MRSSTRSWREQLSMLWGRPVLREDWTEERRVEWIELFFDLAYVAVVSALAAMLSRQSDLVRAGQFVLLFTAAWVVWRYVAIYTNRFDTQDLSYRASVLLLMCLVLAMGIGAGEGMPAGFRTFCVAYALAQLGVLTLFWLRGGRHNRQFMPFARRLAVFHVISLSLWTAAAFVGAPYGWGLLAVGLTTDLATPLVTSGTQDRLPRLSESHLRERFGLFTIIVLGEAVLSVASSLSRLQARTVASWSTGFTALLLITCVYWLYFDGVMVASAPQTALRRNLAQYLHLVLTAAIATLAAILPEILEVPGMPLSGSSRLLFGFGFCMVLVALALLEAMMINDEGLECLMKRTRLMELAGAAIVAVATLIFVGWPAIAFLTLAVAVGLVIVLRSAFVRTCTVDS